MPPDPVGRTPARPAALDDLLDLAHLQVNVRAAAPMPTAIEGVEQIAERLAAGEVWLIAGPDGMPKAYLCLRGDWLEDLYVAVEEQGRGLGTALLDLAREQRPQGFGLWAFVENAQARAFYRHHGLLELERTDGSACAEQAPEVRMVWPGQDPRAFLTARLAEVEADLRELADRRAALIAALAAEA